MSTYSNTLDAWLKQAGCTELALAQAINVKQPNINRYRNGNRFPDAEIARAIDTATGGEVSFETWRATFLKRSGIGAAA